MKLVGYRTALPMAAIVLSSLGLKAQNDSLPDSFKPLVITATNKEDLFTRAHALWANEGGGIVGRKRGKSDPDTLANGNHLDFFTGDSVNTDPRIIVRNPKTGDLIHSLVNLRITPNNEEERELLYTSHKNYNPFKVTLPTKVNNTSATSDTAFIVAKCNYLVSEMSRLRKGKKPKKVVTQEKDKNGNITLVTTRFTFKGPKGNEPYVELKVSKDSGYELYWRPTEDQLTRYYLWSDHSDKLGDGELMVGTKKRKVSQLTVKDLGYGSKWF